MGRAVTAAALRMQPLDERTNGKKWFALNAFYKLQKIEKSRTKQPCILAGNKSRRARFMQCGWRNDSIMKSVIRMNLVKYSIQISIE